MTTIKLTKEQLELLEWLKSNGRTNVSQPASFNECSKFVTGDALTALIGLKILGCSEKRNGYNYPDEIWVSENDHSGDFPFLPPTGRIG